MKTSIKNEHVNKKQGAEFYDIPMSFVGWVDHAEDYHIVAELIPRCRSTAEALQILHSINGLLPKGTKEVFDGQQSTLEYLIDKKLMTIKDIRNPILKKLVVEHVNVTKECPRKIDKNRWSSQAMRCKAITIGLLQYAGKLMFTKKSVKTASLLQSLGEDDFPVLSDDVKDGRLSENSMKKLVAVNAVWIGLANVAPRWKDVKWGIAEITVDGVRLAFSGTVSPNELSTLWQRLQPYTNKIVSQYINNYHDGGYHDCCMAMCHAAMIILYRLIDRIPPEAKQHLTYRVDGFPNKFLEYIYEDDFSFQKWFLDYYEHELVMRIKFIKLLDRSDIIIPPWPGLSEGRMVAYLPVLESFRFLTPIAQEKLVSLISIFHNKKIPTEDKDEIAKNIVFNIQKLIALSDTTKPLQFEYMNREAFTSLVLDILLPKIKSLAAREYSRISQLHRERYPYNDLISGIQQTINGELIFAILEYDEKVVPSFFGYIDGMLWKKVRSALREPHVTEDRSESFDAWDDYQKEQNEALFTAESITETIDQEKLRNEINKCLYELPEQTRKAVVQKFMQEKNQTDTQRKAKNRGLKILKKRYPELKKLL